ncbi:hypothetical protein KQX54_005536 [Cotesia glomerata]|uniref:Uncharacterized protein n=1 Tax=Cotesia glomerata TaxID=32391 RepID=A0AAV7I2Y4_COTGL|nr:hypothetical protein KQX54_005536 [Cotesia glomerata]
MFVFSHVGLNNSRLVSAVTKHETDNNFIADALEPRERESWMIAVSFHEIAEAEPEKSRVRELKLNTQTTSPNLYIRIYKLTLNSFSPYPIVCYICIYERSAPQYKLTLSISIAIRSLTV